MSGADAGGESDAGGELTPGTELDAGALALPHEPLPEDEVHDGHPTTATRALATLGDTEIGVWEMTPGTASDVEADEVFVVLAGRATIAFDDPDLPDLDIRPGSVVRLAEGMRTVWTVRETLRKIYVA